MYERKSRLSSRDQTKLIEHFVAGATARAASEIIGIQANTAIRFYQRLRQLIASKATSYLGKWKLMKVILAELGKENVVEVQQEK